MDKKEVWKLYDLIDAYEAGEIPENTESYFAFYPTPSHEKNESTWWMPYSELVSYAQVRKERQKSMQESERIFLWGK